MTYRIAKRFQFSAAHYLPNLPDDHKCRRLHGHTYRVEVVVTAADELDRRGFVVDFAELDPIGAYLARQFDHQCLNDMVDNPTTENLARIIFECAETYTAGTGARVACVRVSETPATWVEYGSA